MGLGRYLIGRGMLQCLKQKVPECADWYEVGSIAGCKSLGLGRLLGGLPSPNDGVVAVEETRISGTRDQIILNESHSSMLISAGVAHQVCMFLQYGHFFHNLGIVITLKKLRTLSLFVVISLAFWLDGCANIPYYAQAVDGQIDIMRRAKPINMIVADPSVDKKLKHVLSKVVLTTRICHS